LERLLVQRGDVRQRVAAVLIAHSRPRWRPETHGSLDQALMRHGLDAIPRAVLSGQPCAVLHFVAWLHD
jgi:hypothetical protein